MDRDGPAFERSLGLVSDLVADSRGNVYFLDNNTVIRRATPAGRVETFAPASGPNYLAIDSADNLYAAERGFSNYADIARFTPAGDRTLFAGTGPGLLDDDSGRWSCRSLKPHASQQVLESRLPAQAVELGPDLDPGKPN
jgi:hypothetical protein